MGFKSFITSGWNRLKSDIHQGLIGAKNAAHHIWSATNRSCGLVKVGVALLEGVSHCGGGF